MRFFLCFFFFLAACSKFDRSSMQPTCAYPEEWKGEALEEEVELSQWWLMFEDPVLNSLEEAAIQNNKQQAIAYQRMLQSYDQSLNRYGAIAPVLSLVPSYFRQGSLLRGDVPIDTGATTQDVSVPVTGVNSNRRVLISNVQMPLNFSWELDLWGKLSQSYLSAYYTYQQSAFDLQQTMNQITSDVAFNYYLLRGFDTEIEVLDRLIRSRRENFEVNKERYAAGLINYVDVARAEVDLGSSEADKENVIRERAIQENILASLIGMSATEFSVAFASLSLDVLPPKIPIGLPSSLLRRRPDILAKERAVAAFHAKIGVAYADFFPDVILSGALGYSGNALQTLFDWQSRLWQIAASATQILYNGGRLQAQLDEAVAAYKETVFSYEQTVLESFKEVENALISIQQRERQENYLISTLKAAEDAYNLSLDRYKAGLTNYLDVVIAERDLLNISRSIALLHAQRFADTALLVKSVGGGF